MADSLRSAPIVRFGLFEADLRSAELRKNGHKIRLQDQPFQVLAILLAHPGEVVTREEIRRLVWPEDTFVDFDHALNTAIAKIRAALEDEADNPRFVETIPRRGYRLIDTQVSLPDFWPAPKDIAPAVTDSTQRSTGGVTSSIRPWRTGGLVLASFLLLVAGFWTYSHHLSSKAPSLKGHIGTEKIKMIVLPFEDLSHDPGQEYFADGMTEEMITELGGLEPERLKVVARLSSMKYRDTGKTIQQIGRELGVDYVLASSVRRNGGRIRITSQLIDAHDQTHVWAQSFDRDLGDVLSVQGEIARLIANEVQIQLRTSTGESLPNRPVNREAYEDYLKGLYFLHKYTQADWLKARRYLENAIKKDPSYAPPYSGLAEFYLWFGWLNPQHSDPAEFFAERVLKMSEPLARKAVAMDDTFADGHLTLANIYMYQYWDWPAAEREIKRALELNPSSAKAHDTYSTYLAVSGHVDESLAESERAVELDPLDSAMQVSLGYILRILQRNEDAIAAEQRAIELDPTSPSPHEELAILYEKKGMYSESIAEWQSKLVLDHDPEERTDADLLRQVYNLKGFEVARKAVWNKQLDRAKKKLKAGYHESSDLAALFAQLDKKNEAFFWLQRACVEQRYVMVFLKFDPMYDNLRADSRYQALLDAARLPAAN